jgi:hypothetical protein
MLEDVLAAEIAASLPHRFAAEKLLTMTVKECCP